ncbi:MAG: FTR1 family protein [Micrococcales bacterium]|nr:FTR1 family protein [Micrococcales bacterium]
MLPNYLIGLREGLEAGLIVGILVAYLAKLGRRDLLGRLWLGVAGALVLSLGVAAILTWGPYGLSFQGQEALGGGLSIVAVGFVTWMILWMARHARTLKSELHSRTDVAIGGSAVALVVLGVVSVGREGIETALFVWASVSATQNASVGVAGALLGIATAVVLSVLLAFGVIRIDLSRFFRWTGVFLVIVAAGVLAYGIGELQEADILPGAAARAYDITALVPPTSWWGVLLAGIFNVTAEPTWAQVASWIVYAAVVGVLFVRRQRPRATSELPAGRARTIQPVPVDAARRPA